MYHFPEIEYNITYLSTEEFWEKMCNFRFVRISYWQGRIGNELFFVNDPPEDKPLFILSKLDNEIIKRDN